MPYNTTISDTLSRLYESCRRALKVKLPGHLKTSREGIRWHTPRSVQLLSDTVVLKSGQNRHSEIVQISQCHFVPNKVIKTFTSFRI